MSTVVIESEYDWVFKNAFSSEGTHLVFFFLPRKKAVGSYV